MKTNRFSHAVVVTTALACAATFMPVMLSSPVSAQTHPTMTNVIPDGGSFATQGKIQALDPGASTLTIVPEGSPPS